MNGVATTTSSEVVKFAQTSSGIRQKVIPGARIVMIVTRKLRAVRIDEAPAHWTPRLKIVWPIGAPDARAGYPVQPAAKAPPGARKLAMNMIPAIGSSQNESAFSRGKAMSGAPSMSGTAKFASPANAGGVERGETKRGGGAADAATAL